LLSFSYAIQGSFAGKIFKLTGASSLYIYVMHRIPLTLSIAVLSKTILMTYPVVVFLVLFAIAVLTPLIIKKYLIVGKLNYLFKQPFFGNPVANTKPETAS